MGIDTPHPRMLGGVVAYGGLNVTYEEIEKEVKDAQRNLNRALFRAGQHNIRADVEIFQTGSSDMTVASEIRLTLKKTVW